MDNKLPLVKVISKTGNLPRQISASNTWNGFCFTFDRAERHYDWLVVYDDIPVIKGGGPSREILACSPENTILVTHEPSAVKTFGTDFINQFNFVFTCHEDFALQHKNKIASHPFSPWWYGAHLSPPLNYDALNTMPPIEKSKELSTVCSTKQQTHTLHQKRYQFTRQLSILIPQIEWFGHGLKPIADKTEAIDAYRYHIAIENYICPHYWTEKLADSYLGYCLPFYYGCPNIAQYFPEESYIIIDINDVTQSEKIIKEAIQNNEYKKRLPAIIEARRRLLEEHNFYQGITDVMVNTPLNKIDPIKKVIYSRRQLITRNPIAAIRYIGQKYRSRRITKKIK